jgi:hypothetical protein
MNNITGGMFQPVTDNIQNFQNRTDKAIDGANNFNVFGMKIGKGWFKDDKEVKRLEELQRTASDLLKDINDVLKSAFAPRQSQ